MKHRAHKTWHTPKPAAKQKTTAYEELRSREIAKIEIRKLNELLSEKPEVGK